MEPRPSQFPRRNLRWLRKRVLVRALGSVLALVFGIAQAGDATAPSLRPAGVPHVAGMLVLAGSLHDHSTDSDGDASPKRITDWLHSHRTELGIDYAALTDHADFFPLSFQAIFRGNVWRAENALADRSADDFPFIRGFEYTSDQENHLGVLASENFLSGVRSHEKTMDKFYRWIASEPTAIGSFNHPSAKGALQWDDLTFDPRAARAMTMIEVHGDQDEAVHNQLRSDAGWYWLALARGWTVAPAMNWDTHRWFAPLRGEPGLTCGDVPRSLPCQRTLIIARSNGRSDVLEALRARRVSASEDPGMWATLRTDDTWQGATIARPPSGVVTLRVDAGSTRALLQNVEIIGGADLDPHEYFDGDNLHCGRSPAACDREAQRDGQLAEGYLEQHWRFMRSGGFALRKAQIDGPPPNAQVAIADIQGSRSSVTMSVYVPAARSHRPDGKYFYYAIVHAGALRTWTAPIFVAPER